MISHLKLYNIGPVRDLEEALGSRLNISTGDNGLGKTFLLDACWYALTRTWANDNPIIPPQDVPKDLAPHIAYSVVGKAGGVADGVAKYDFGVQGWKKQKGRPTMSGLTIYARIDGGFSVWDPARNYWHSDEEERTAAFQFTKDNVWDGLESGEGERKKVICNGLLRDVESWRNRGDKSFLLLENVLKQLSPNENELIRLGESVRVRLDDARDIPTLVMPYGPVPVTLAAAGMRRVLALAYLLVWAAYEHRKAAELRKEEPTDRIVLLFDEVEAHLHPKWQRVFMPALLAVIDSLILGGNAKSAQVIATTHSPLVLSSMESTWDDDNDRLFDFDYEDKKVVFRRLTFARFGSAEHWLVSNSFDLPSAYPKDAQVAMERADAFMREYPDPRTAPNEEKHRIHQQLRNTLGGDDEYWPYWQPYYSPLHNSEVEHAK